MNRVKYKCSNLIKPNEDKQNVFKRTKRSIE